MTIYAPDVIWTVQELAKRTNEENITNHQSEKGLKKKTLLHWKQPLNAIWAILCHPPPPILPRNLSLPIPWLVIPLSFGHCCPSGAAIWQWPEGIGAGIPGRLCCPRLHIGQPLMYSCWLEVGREHVNTGERFAWYLIWKNNNHVLLIPQQWIFLVSPYSSGSRKSVPPGL